MKKLLLILLCVTLLFSCGDNLQREVTNKMLDDGYTGQGTYTYASGSKYEGEFNEGKRNGQGTYTYASGSKYVGEWKDDKIHGQGTYTYADGDKYEGEFNEGKRHGQGTYTTADGKVVKGLFENDVFVPKYKPFWDF